MLILYLCEIVGYGVEEGIAYWTLANSWGPNWGNNGYFRVVRGIDECLIESEVVLGLPQL